MQPKSDILPRGEATDKDRDALTGLFKRSVFEGRLREAIDRDKGGGEPCSLIFADIDHFMAVNKRQGHDIGDAVIRAVADEIGRIASQPKHVAARYGGEEFAILLPGVEREQAFLMAEAIRTAMDAERSYQSGEANAALRVTLSAGVSAFPTDGGTGRDVLRRADQALFRAKDTGRNKVCIAEEERMAAKTSHFTLTQLARLSRLSNDEGVGEAVLLREALDDLLTKYQVSEIES